MRATANKLPSTIVSLPLGCVVGDTGSSSGRVSVVRGSISGSSSAIVCTPITSQWTAHTDHSALSRSAQQVPVIKLDSRVWR
jgi:hypothetical protein